MDTNPTPDDKTTRNALEELEEPTNEEPLVITISGLSVDNNQIKINIAMKTSLPQYERNEAMVTRTCSDLENLHAIFLENPKYAGLIIPPLIPQPELEVDRDSLAFYTEDEDPESEVFQKMRSDLQREYISKFNNLIFHYTRFLKRAAASSILRTNWYFMEFLTQPNAINLATQSSKISNLVTGLSKQMSDSWSWLGKPEPDVDSFFDIINKQTATDFELYGRLLADAEKMIVCEKRISNFKVIWSQAYEVLSRLNAEHEFFFHVGKFFEHIRNIELAIPQKEDLHLVQLIKYHHNMTKATKDTLGRRKDVLKKKKLSAVAYETAQRTGQNVGIASENFKGDEKKFEDISDLCKAEINSYQRERVALFKANLTDYCKFQIEYSQKILSELDRFIEKLMAES